MAEVAVTGPLVRAILAAIRRLAPDKTAERKLLFGNAKRVLALAV